MDHLNKTDKRRSALIRSLSVVLIRQIYCIYYTFELKLKWVSKTWVNKCKYVHDERFVVAFVLPQCLSAFTATPGSVTRSVYIQHNSNCYFGNGIQDDSDTTHIHIFTRRALLFACSEFEIEFSSHWKTAIVRCIKTTDWIGVVRHTGHA